MRLWTGHEADVAANTELGVWRAPIRLRVGPGIGPAVLAHPGLPLGPQPDGTVVLTTDAIDCTETPWAIAQERILATHLCLAPLAEHPGLLAGAQLFGSPAPQPAPARRYRVQSADCAPGRIVTIYCL
jgi:hypothetical protein